MRVISLKELSRMTDPFKGRWILIEKFDEKTIDDLAANYIEYKHYKVRTGKKNHHIEVLLKRK